MAGDIYDFASHMLILLAGTTDPHPGSNLLLEDGVSNILLENGVDAILLEP